MLEKVSCTIQRIKKSDTDPLINYAKVYGNRSCNFEIKTITIHKLQKTIHLMKSSWSAGVNGISIKIIK